MQEDQLLKKLNTELEVTSMGDYRKFKFVNSILSDEDLTVNFFVNVLGYKRWKANQINYIIKYHKKIYQQNKLILRQ